MAQDGGVHGEVAAAQARMPAALVDDLDINKATKDTIILIDDVFNRVNPENKEKSHIESYILALIKSLSNTVQFPILLTNEGRAYDNSIHPFRESLTEYYFDYHLLFEKSHKPNKVLVKRFDGGNYFYFTELIIDQTGLITELF